MKKKKFKKIYVMIILQILLVAGCLFYANNRHLEQYWYDGSQMVYIDVHEENEQYRKICSPQTELKVGSYRFEMVYTSSGEESEITFTNCGSETFAIENSSEMYLYEGKHDFDADFRLSYSLEGFSAIVICPEGEEFQVDSVLLSETNDALYGSLFYLFLVFVIVDMVCILSDEKALEYMNNKKSAFYAVAIAAFFSGLPLMVHYLMNGHDLEFHLLRIDGIATALANGDFPVRMHPNFMDGYGYPTGIYYPELFLYLPAALHLIGIPLMQAYKWFLLVENIVTAVFAWYGGKIIFKNEKYASLFCILYTLLPYRMINEYYRAAVGESLAMMFLPLLIAAMYLLLGKNTGKKELKKATVLLTVAVSGVLQSHILSCEIYAIFGLLIVLVCIRRFMRPQVLLAVLKSVVWVILLNLWFLIPFLEGFGLDLNVFNHSSSGIGTQGLNLWQLFAFTPEAGGISRGLTEGISNEMPLYLGWATVICLFIGLVGVEKLYQERKDDRKAMGVICFVAGCIAAWMTTYLFPWNLISGVPKLGEMLQTVQFPWRYLSVAGGLILVAGLIALMSWKNENNRKKMSMVLVGIAVFVTLSFCQSMVENKAYYTVYNEAGLDVYTVMGKEYLYPGTDVEELKDNPVSSSWYYREKGSVICEIEAGNAEETVYYLPLLYYPWYEALDAETGEKLPVIKGDNNVAVLEVPENYSGTVVVSFAEPLLWKIGTVVSFVAGIMFLLYVVFWQYKKCLFCKEKKHPNTV